MAALVVAAVAVSQFSFFRLDLTEDQRFSLNESTEALIDQVEDPLLITLYLDGDFPTGFQRLKEETRRMLDEFRARNGNIQYVFINPSENPDPQARRDTYQQLRNAGLNAIQIEVQEADGVKQQQIFPGAIATYRDREWSIALLLEQFATAPEAQINASIQNLEYTLASALKGLTASHRPSIALLDGHGELSPVKLPPRGQFGKRLRRRTLQPPRIPRRQRQWPTRPHAASTSFEQLRPRRARQTARFLQRPGPLASTSTS